MFVEVNITMRVSGEQHDERICPSFIQNNQNIIVITDNVWSTEVSIPCDIDVHYRYFIASIDPSHQESVHVRKWETHLRARRIPKGDDIQNSNDIETLGDVNGILKLDKGWLTNETILQFKFFNNPFFVKE